MIYPFTRMVVYGAIWYQGNAGREKCNCIALICISGEANADYHLDKYSCSFAKMIEYWRQTWYQRTNGITNIDFPFGFVQVNVTRHSSMTMRSLNCSYQHGQIPVLKWVVFLGFAGIKHSMLVMYRIES